ncbi:MAG TPA: HAD family hydrolase [Actinomycetes bacterium]|nr:HAD family hydrolase [Actinomycetes bacterium]
MSETELVIFDCDGVLVDSEHISVRLEVTLLAELGWELTEAEIAERFLGRTDQYMIEQIEAHIGRKLPAGWPEETALRYREALATALRPVDGVVEALDRIDTQTCVASSGSHDKMAFTLGLTGLYPRFEGRIFSSSEVANGKPAPDLFLHAARQLGVEPARCVVVEDSRAGVAAARNAGMRAFGYAGGLTAAHRLEGPGTTVFREMRELPELIRAS